MLSNTKDKILKCIGKGKASIKKMCYWCSLIMSTNCLSKRTDFFIVKNIQEGQGIIFTITGIGPAT